MDHLVRFPLAGGDGVVVQLTAPPAQGPQLAANASSVLHHAQMGFEEAAGKLRPIAQVMLDQIKDLGPHEVRLELAVRFCAEAGLILAKSGAEGHCKLELIWKPR